MKQFRDLKGRTFGCLHVSHVLGPVFRRDGRRRDVLWACLCSCGETTTASSSHLVGGFKKSCGHLRKEVIGRLRRTHNYAHKEKLYKVWQGMKERCSNPSHVRYHRYGGRGIQVSEPWQSDYLSFRTWAMDHGYSLGLQIDRINNDGNYDPENCQWVDSATNAKNKGSRTT